MSLFSKAESFLIASGYDTESLPTEKDFLIAKKPHLGGAYNITCIGVAEKPLEASSQHLIVERFERVTSQYPTATLTFLSGTTGGYQAGIRRDLRDLGVTFLTPARFFDTPFRYDNNPSVASTVKDLADSGKAQETMRVKQPFVISASDEQGDDLAEYLLEEVQSKSRSSSPSPTLWIVSAPAGYGKSFMFASLFHKVYDFFQNEKRAQRIFPRPLPMIAEHLRAAAGPNINGLIDVFVQTDFAGHTPPELFSWMIDNGHGFWMADGLDEVITSDDDFPNFILDRLTQPFSSAPLILISLRDSLLRSSEPLHELIAITDDDVIRHIELLPWKRQQKRSFAWTKVHQRLPQATDTDDETVRDLLEVLTTDEHDKLSSTPFYAGMLADEFLAETLLEPRNEFDLLEFAISEMCRREYAKEGPIQESVLPIKTFRDWLEELAGEVVNQSGISIDDLLDFANHVEVFTMREIPPEEKESLVKQLMVMPFLKTNQDSGRFEFTHEILGEFLAGSFYAKQMQVHTNRDWGRRYLDQQALPSDSMLLKVIAWNFREMRSGLIEAIRHDSITTPGTVHRNIVQLLALMANGRELLDRIGISLERADLSGIQFHSMDLQRVSFVGSDLSFADLSTCNLQDANFELALFRDTLLPSRASESLQGATFDNMRNFTSIFECSHQRQHRISSYDDFLDWAGEATNVPIRRDLPCPSARQLTDIFGKFVFPNGTPRKRQWIAERALLRQKQIEGGPRIRDTVKTVYEFGYLTQTRSDRRGAGRPDIQDDRYREIVRFMRDSALSQGLSDLLADLCQIPDCRHTAPTKQL